MDAAENESAVRHNVAGNRFEVEIEGRLAVAEYTRCGNEMTMTHTVTPPELRGRGLAGTVVRAALEHARAEKLRVVPTCSYVARFIELHPEYRSLLR